MLLDEKYIEQKTKELKDMIESGTFKKDKCNDFIDYDDLEDKFSHSEIDKAQNLFMDKAHEYLSKNYPGKYAMWCDYCVHITTIELYEEIMRGKSYRARYDIIN